MAPTDEAQSAAAALQGADENAGAAAYRNMVDPFHLAIAELRHDNEELNVEAPRPGAPPRQTILLSQPVRGLGLGEWIGVGVAALVLGLLGGLLSQAFRPNTPPAADPAVAKDLAAIKSSIGALADKQDTLDRRVAAEESKPAPQTDLSSLERQIAELKKADDDLRPVRGQIRELDARAGSLVANLKQMRHDLTEIGAKVDTVQASARDVAARAATFTSADGGESKPKHGATLAQGAELFKQGRYKDALGIFNKLELIDPDDARVWYYAALAHGFATADWGGDTAELVNHGIERERAGTPDAATIDEAFKGLTVNSGKTWLEGYRQRAKP